ncbi:MAG: hypothetical protein C5B55_01700 [Blastocatellia bacterium]|nr:MAG: hypothetical protein C5B55_01700 [Blastocatellia bacterium]
MTQLNPRRALLSVARNLNCFLPTTAITSVLRQQNVNRLVTGLFCSLAFVISGVVAEGQQVVTNGRFTNVYVYQPTFAGESWDDHLKAARSQGDQFSREKIDAFTDTLMGPDASSYFDFLHQYWGVNEPQFFGSGFATADCVSAALHDGKNLGNNITLIQWDTVRSLANCHPSGLDPSPQVTLIFSPDIKVANIPNPPIGTAGDMCTTSPDKAWHAWGLNMPNFIALPTDPNCSPTFDNFTINFSHEIVETLTDPGGFGQGGVLTDPTNVGGNEIGDKCKNQSIKWGSYSLQQYWSNNTNACEPRVLRPPTSSAERDWLDTSGIPLQRFKGNQRDLPIKVYPANVGSPAKSLRMIISTGNDNLRGDGDNCDVTINLSDGRTISLPNVNQGQTWDNWTTHSFDVPIPATGVKGGDITEITLHTVKGGFDLTKSPDNWNVQRVQLKATLGSARIPTPRSLPSTTVTVTVNQVGSRIAMGPRIPGMPASSAVYGMIRINGSEFEKSPLSQSMLYDLGTIPIQIEVWQDLPDVRGSGNPRDPNNPGGRGVHNAKATLRTLNIDYNLKTHTFTVRGESGSAMPGKAGVEFAFPGDSTHPGIAFTITDQPGTR